MAEFDDVIAKLNECAEKADFEAAFALVKENRAELEKALKAEGVRDALKKTTNDRLLLSFMDGAGFGAMPFDRALNNLEKLVAFSANVPGSRGTLVLNATWGLGTVRRLDYFYKRITVDFRQKKGHQFTYAAACDMLAVAPKDHILVLRETAREDFDAMLKDKKGDFVKAVIRSNGSSMTLIKLEDYCLANGFVKSQNWKEFWNAARVELVKDKCVVIPAKKTEPITLKAAKEDYGDSWVSAFAHETDPKVILASVREYIAEKKFAEADEGVKNAIGSRLQFAITAAAKVDDALYARLACLTVSLGYLNPPAEKMRGYLWDRKRYVKAAAELPAREVGEMISLLAVDDDAKAKLYATIPEFCFSAVTEIVNRFGSEAPCREAIAALMKQPKAPATLTTLLVGKYRNFRGWTELPELIILLTHAIALGEGRQGGETLKMQNMIRRLFADTKWLAEMFGYLTPENQALFFERFQASIAWEPASHKTTVIRMTHIVPDLERHLVKVEKKKEYARVTSFRSFAMKKQEYLKLINEDMPENVRKIEFAKGFGDLSENAEYQYAKDEQRQLMQKQALMQADLEVVKPGDFAEATTDEVMPGVTVVIETAEGEKTYHVLGEWDNEVELGVLSQKAKLAVNMLGKKVGDQFELPGTEGVTAFGTVKEIKALPENIREWMKLPAGMQI